MIQQINGLAGDVAAFRVSGEVTKEDYDSIILPTVENITSKFNHLNFLLVLNTDLKNYTWGAWMDDALVTLKNLAKFKRVALVTDSEMVKKVTSFGAHFIPGEYRTYKLAEEASAVNWVGAAEL